MLAMASYRMGDAAAALGVSVDTLRRWVDAGRVPSTRTAGGQRVLEGAALAELAKARSAPAAQATQAGRGVQATQAGRGVQATQAGRGVQATQAGRGVQATQAGHSARNRLLGVVTGVTRDGLMAQVELQCGPHRIVSVVTREAADELGLEPGVLAMAAIKSTSVTLERHG